MFLNQSYIEVNREERHYCSLLAHALLSSEIVREEFAALVSEEVKLDPAQTEVFIEVAALRDYWHALYDGNPRLYNDTTSANRKAFLEEILTIYDIPIDIIGKEKLFWTKGIGSKLWNPGHWTIPEIEKPKLGHIDQLKKLKWAFNAKPDMMIVSNNQAILVEAKLESGEGKYGDDGIGQREIQETIGELMPKLIIPAFEDIVFHNMLLAKKLPKDNEWQLSITWKEIIEIIMKAKAQLDAFTVNNFEQLLKR
ncbi:hypothetical protein ACFLUO_07340 [Chloroflexota bacterium]